MLPHPLSRLHTYLREMRKHVPQSGKLAGRTERIKNYERMERFVLPRRAPSIDIAGSFSSRSSALAFGRDPIPMSALGGALDLALAVHHEHRPYPSGGGLYPVETYIIVRSAETLSPGAFHYRPDLHALEHLWMLPDVPISDLVNDGIAHHAGALVIFTAVWVRTALKYGEFSLELALLEAGHAAQNMILATHAHGIASRPFCSFRDDLLTSALDLEPEREQVLYTLAIGATDTK